MSNLQRPNIAAVAHDLPGQHVIFADGDELGIITDVVETTGETNGIPTPALVVEIVDAVTDTLAGPVVISGESVLVVTDDAVVLGTTARWLDQHTVAELDSC